MTSLSFSEGYSVHASFSQITYFPDKKAISNVEWVYGVQHQGFKNLELLEGDCHSASFCFMSSQTNVTNL
jgi:hypothetical protein